MYDALIIIGGGLTSAHEPHEWVKRRIDIAVEHKDKTSYFIATSFASPHKPLPLDSHGLPISEAYITGLELIKHGIEPERILYENYSVDTLGNIFFSRFIHTDIRNLNSLGIITSEFHMPRTHILSEWIFNLAPQPHTYTIDYLTASDQGIDTNIILPRIKKEQLRIDDLKRLQRTIRTVTDLHTWLYTKHAGYTLHLRDQLLIDRADSQTQKSY